MHKIKVKHPDGSVFEGMVTDGMDLMDAVNEVMGGHDEVPNSCNRGSWCGTCALTILKGRIGPLSDSSIDVNEMDGEELETMNDHGLDPKRQVLSCACQVWGDLEVEIPSEGEEFQF